MAIFGKQCNNATILSNFQSNVFYTVQKIEQSDLGDVEIKMSLITVTLRLSN